MSTANTSKDVAIQLAREFLHIHDITGVSFDSYNARIEAAIRLAYMQGRHDADPEPEALRETEAVRVECINRISKY